MPWVCLGLQVVLVATSLVLYRATGIDVRWSSDAGFFALLGLFVVVWVGLTVWPGGGRVVRSRVAKALGATIVFLALVQITAPMQYGALALGRPFVDADLARADGWVGIDVARLTLWTARYPPLVAVLNITYNTLVPQLLVPLVVLPFAGDRDALWEYLWHLHISIAGALVCLALWPAVCPFTYRHYDPLVSPALVRHLTTQIREVHAGRMRVLGLQDMQGLISFPSFHAAAACAVTWSLRRQRVWIWGPVAILNVGLVSATVLLGIHYATDLAGTGALLGASLAAYRLLVGSEGWFANRSSINATRSTRERRLVDQTGVEPVTS